MSEVRLLLVDDHAVVRTGLRMLLESQSDLRIIGEASTGAEALEMAESEKPHIIVMDITLPDMSGIEVTRRLKQTHPEIAIVALTIHEDEQYFFEMLQAGAAGYVPKRAAPDDLIGAIRAAAMGEIYLYPSLAKALVADYLSHAGSEPQRNSLEEPLTPREEEVMRLVAQGLTNDEIAEQLVISRHTVARHRENLMRKLGLHNRSELVKYAIRKGIIAP
jgi:two-component system response regulator NreC